MYVAIGALTLLQLAAGLLLTRATRTVDRLADTVAELSRADAARSEAMDRIDREVTRLRDRVPHQDANREQADLADRELRRLLLEELRASRALREGRAA